MRAIVAKAAVVAAATVGLAASFLVPLGLERHEATAEALRMPVATHETTVSVFPAPGRLESSPRPVERPQPRAARRPSGPTPPLRPPHSPVTPTSRPVKRGPIAPIRPQTDVRLLAELGPERPDDRSPRLLVAE